MRGTRQSRRASASIAAVMLAASSLVGCSLLLDWDFSAGDGSNANPDAGAGGDGGPGPDGAAGDAASTGVDGGDAALVDASADGGLDGALDCTGAQICDDFEGRTAPAGTPRVGSWNDNAFSIGDASIVTDVVFHGARSFLAELPANAGASVPLGSVLRANMFTLGTLGAVTATFEIELDYAGGGYGADGAHHFADIYANGVDDGSQETVGIYSKTDGLALVLRTYDTGGVAHDVPKTIPTDLRTGFHHVVLDVVFSTSATGGSAMVKVDGATPVTLGPARTMRTKVSTYEASFGATLQNQTPAMKARFDDIVVTTR